MGLRDGSNLVTNESFSYFPEIVCPETKLWDEISRTSGLKKVTLLKKLSEYSSSRGKDRTASLLLENAISLLEELSVNEQNEFLGMLYLNLGSISISRKFVSGMMCEPVSMDGSKARL